MVSHVLIQSHSKINYEKLIIKKWSPKTSKNAKVSRSLKQSQTKSERRSTGGGGKSG